MLDQNLPGDHGYHNTIVEPSGEVQRRALAAWEDIMRARTADEAHAVVDELDEATLRRTCQRMDLPYVEAPAAMRDQVSAAVEERAEDLRLYEQQPFDDLTGVPDQAGQRPCPREGCVGTLAPVAGSQHFDADGGGSVDTECDRGCGMASGDSWVWSRHESPAEDPTYHADDEDSADPDDPPAGGAGTSLGWALNAAAIPADGYAYGPDGICAAHGQRCATAGQGSAARSETSTAGSVTPEQARPADNGHDDTDGW